MLRRIHIHNSTLKKEEIMKKFLLALIGVLFFAPSVFAAPYGDAGCGLGSLIFADKRPGFIQVLAATTNGTSYNQAFGITSGTSNCDTGGIQMAEKKQEIFVVQNFNSLAKEMATGEGETLETLAGLLGCGSDKQGLFNSFAQKQYGTIFATERATPISMLSTVKEGIAYDPELSVSCRQ
jgi:hypothetical protein